MKQLGLAGAVVTAALIMAGAVPPPALAAPTRAPTAEEQKAFADGLRAYEAGDARAAERSWRAGYSVAHDPAFLVRIGEAQEKAGVPQDAVQSYQQYLRESPDAADRADIEARVRRLAPPSAAPAAVEVETPGELGGSGAPGNAGSPAGPRPAAAPGVPAAVVPAAGAPQARDDSHEDLVPLVEDEPPHSPMNIVAWVGTGVTAALLGTAAFFGASAAERSGDANRLLLYFDEKTGVPQEYATRAQEFEDDVRIGKRDDRLAKIFAIAAGATAIASAVLFVLDARAEKPARPVAQGRTDDDAGSRGRSLRFSATGTSLRWSF